MPQADVITLLDADHQRVELLFRDFQSTTADPTRRKDLAEVICLELTVHATLEEELFYPAYAQASGDQKLVEEARREHQEARELIAQVHAAADPSALVLQLQKLVEHHVEEERREIFPRARAAGMDLEGLARQLEERRTELATQMQEA